ncbi:hypothetical protein ACOAKC_08920 [Hathewaya histolytica]|uniref:hypothetical protein n=1 Tax=Hathewaya histolytica TaxID=1498 RepID=UPI003B673B6C
MSAKARLLFEKENVSGVKYEHFLCKTLLNFNRETWRGLDICYTKNWFGSSPNKFKRLIVSNKLYKVLVENNIKNVYFQPSYFVD